MEVGHPVTVPSGAHGIISGLRENGMTDVDLIGGATVRVPHTELKSYFENPLSGGTVANDDVKPPAVFHSTRSQIFAIMKAAGEIRLTGKEIHARGNFESSVQVYNELSALYRKHSVLGREKRPVPGNPAVYQYWLVPGAKLPTNDSPVKAKQKHLAQPGQADLAPPSQEGHAAGTVLNGPIQTLKPVARTTSSLVIHGEPELPEAYTTVLRDLIAKRDKLNSAITALEILMGQA